MFLHKKKNCKMFPNPEHCPYHLLKCAAANLFQCMYFQYQIILNKTRTLLQLQVMYHLTLKHL